MGEERARPFPSNRDRACATNLPQNESMWVRRWVVVVEGGGSTQSPDDWAEGGPLILPKGFGEFPATPDWGNSIASRDGVARLAIHEVLDIWCDVGLLRSGGSSLGSVSSRLNSYASSFRKLLI